jgi:flagellar assembly factor FliW
MQALDKSAICFVCVESFVICPSYNVNIPDAFTESLEIKPPRSPALNLVTVRQKLEDITPIS